MSRCYDITRELFSTPAYPGDPAPQLHRVRDMAEGSVYNLSLLSMSAHAGTHMDAPLHFLRDGADVLGIPLEVCMGPCLVCEADALSALPEGVPPRLLLKGEPRLNAERRALLHARGIRLIGVECASAGEAGNEAAAHVDLLKRNVVILENLDLSAVPTGAYTLYALPLKLANAEGAPCRAVLYEA